MKLRAESPLEESRKCDPMREWVLVSGVTGCAKKMSTATIWVGLQKGEVCVPP